MLGLAPADFGLLVLAGLIGSAVNAVAGGGTFFTFPAFLSTGVAPVIANASNAVAIWPGACLLSPHTGANSNASESVRCGPEPSAC